ncbi:MAG: helix-turn-helix transcriptional regulator [Clostridia bacterium]|nr:helix-turn-helix transcriptional regulator [Clostridia bacterium]
MVKAIEITDKKTDFVKFDYFRIIPGSGEWHYATYSYAKDAHYPVVVYGHNKYYVYRNPGTYGRRLNYCTMFICIKVGFAFIFDDIVYYPSKGDVIVIKDYDEFATYMKTNAFEHFYEIDFPLMFFEHMKENNMFSKLFYDTSNTPNIVSLGSESCDRVVQKMNRIEKVISSDSENKDLLVWSYIIQIIDIIFSHRANNNSYLNAHNLPPKLRDAIEYINTNFVNLKSIDEVAEFCKITSTYLARMFKKIFECTPSEYINIQKIAYAKHLLYKGKSITDACFESGFNNYTYFISKFKVIEGVTPSKFQKSYHEDIIDDI